MFEIIVVYSNLTSAHHTFTSEQKAWEAISIVQKSDKAAAIFLYDDHHLIWECNDPFEE